MATYSQGCSNVGSFKYGSRFTLYVELTNRDGNPATNKSIVDYNAYFENTSGGGTFTSNTRLYFAINGSAKKDSTSSITGPRNGRVSIASGSIEVDHNDDGKKKIGFHSLVNSTSFGIYGEISGEFELTTIPRASSVSGGSGNIGSKSTISISRASSSFTHTLRYAFGDLSGTIATGVGTSHTWTIPTSFYAKIPNAKTGTGTIYCDTYNGSSLIGTKSVSFTATAAEDTCRPTVSATIKDTNSTTTALTGNSSKLVKHKSTAQLVITSTVKNSATIKSVTVNGTNVGKTSSITINYSNVTATSFTIVTTDSRGYTNTSYVLTPSYVNYVPLTVNAKFFRPQPTTGEVQLTYSGNYFNGSFGSSSNTLSITWKYKETTASSYTTGGTITPTLSGNTISSKTIRLGNTFNYQKSYDFQLTAVDKLTTTTVNATISIGLPVFNWGKDFFNVNGVIKSNKVSTTELITSRSFLFELDANGTAGKGRYYKIANLPPTSDANAMFLNIKGTIGGWSNKATIDMQITNRDKFIVYTNYIGNPSAFDGQQIVIYQESDGSHTIYLYNKASYTGANTLNITWGNFTTVKPTIYTDYSYVTQPTGSMVHTSTTSNSIEANGGKTLYDNSAGTTGTLTLSESAANFKYLEIHYRLNGSHSQSMKIASPNNSRVSLYGNWATDTGTIQIEAKSYSVTNTTINSLMSSWYSNLDSAGLIVETQNSINIYKVVGYRFPGY